MVGREATFIDATRLDMRASVCPSSTASVVVSSRARARCAARRCAAVVVKSSSSNDDALLRQTMRAKIAATNADPGAENVIATLCELAEQEFGLTGVKFTEVMAKLDECYDFVPTAYSSGVGSGRATTNAAGTNNGSCKTFYFAKMRGLSEDAALRLFCEHYEDVVRTPDGDSHANIRAFMENGYAGLTFEGDALVAKGTSSGANNDV